MTDPIQLLEDLDPESPPGEAVVAAVRLFRYRALSVILGSVVFLVVFGALLGRLQPVSEAVAAEDLGRRAGSVHVPLQVHGSTAGLDISATEFIGADGEGFVRFVFSSDFEQAAGYEIFVAEFADQRKNSRDGEFEQSLDRRFSRSRAVWIPVDRADGFSIVWGVFPVDGVFLEEGGVLTEGEWETVRMEWIRGS